MLELPVLAFGLGNLSCKALYTGSIPVCASHLAPDLGKLPFPARSHQLTGLVNRSCGDLY